MTQPSAQLSAAREKAWERFDAQRHPGRQPDYRVRQRYLDGVYDDTSYVIEALAALQAG